MVIKTDVEFEESMAQLCRFYRAQRQLFSETSAQDKPSITAWVRTGGKIMEKMDEVLSDIEVYSGTADLRITIAELKQMRVAKEGQVIRA